MAPLLPTIHDPSVLRQFDRAQLKQLADEVRSCVLDNVSRTGGHLSSNLGTVELTVALHHVFNTPHDRLVWDVGHQTYPHKILTGRRERMPTLRQLGGISGFPQRSESEYDTFGTAHSSTSISAALGMAMAAKQKGEDRHAVAIIGDGAMTAGMAFEALNNAGVCDCKLLVILNDNDMSISPPVGALNRYLAQLMSGNFYAAAKNVGKTRAARRAAAVRAGQALRGACQGHGGAGHAVRAVRLQLRRPDRRPRPRFAGADAGEPQAAARARSSCTWSPRRARATSWPRPIRWPTTGPPSSIPAIGLVKPATAPKQTFTQVFGHWLCDMAAQDGRLVGITPAMREGSGLVEFEQRFPDRYYDVGIAEQHAVTFAAGLACEGLKPVVAIYSTFLQRAYDQLIHDVAIQNLPVVFALDRAGLVGADGATHAGAYDIAFLRCIPNMSIACPADEAECRQLLTTRLRAGPSGGGALSARRGRRRRARGSRSMRCPSARARSAARAGASRSSPSAPCSIRRCRPAEALDATVVNMRWAKPLDVELLLQIAATHERS